jgi:sugar transferase (PEP-CTERM/EpsH1 system associated)
MEPLLFLVHRLPYPPNKGDKIRSFNILKHLAARYAVHLGTFVDDPADLDHVAPVSALCASTKVCRLHPRAGRVASLAALGSGDPLSLRYFRSRELGLWVARVLAEQAVRRVLVFSSTMAQYVMPRPAQVRLMACDMVDVDSLKWLQYAERARGVLRWVYRREGRTLAAYEGRVASEFDRTSFVSEQEAALFADAHPELRHKVTAIGNGVDLGYFDPEQTYARPWAEGTRAVVFTGAMDYWANVDAVRWYADEVHERVRRACPDARFYIVGSNPTGEVLRLGLRDGVEVTGRVPDVRPYLRHAACVVAPLRIARGVQNKVLEALSMDRPLVATPDALIGIACGERARVPVARDAPAFAEAVIAALQKPDDSAGRGARREVVVRSHSWPASLARLDAVLEPGTVH